MGYAGLTVDAVASRAGVGKAGIYRRFGSKAELVFSAVVHDLNIEPPPDTGSLRGDLTALMQLIHERSGNAAARQVIPALLAEGARSPDLVSRFRQTFLAVEHADFTEICERALRRGELASPVDPELAHLLLAGPHFAAVHVYHLRVDEALMSTVASAVAHGLIALSEREPSRPAP